MKLEEFHKELVERRNERLIEFSKDIPNLISEIPEQKMLIILIDIVGFSKSSTRQQVYDIYRFQRFLITQVLSSAFDFTKNIHISHFVPTGDGCYIVAEECKPEVALKFLVTLLKNYEAFQKNGENQRSLRISADIGYCVPFLDIAKHKNYIGEGMNEVARILSYGQKAVEDNFLLSNPDYKIEDAKVYSRNSLYLSDLFNNCIEEYKTDCDKIIHFEKIADKHGKTRNITVLHNVQ